MSLERPETIPPMDLRGEVAELWKELAPALEAVLRSGHFILGPSVEAFERETARYLGVKHAIGLNSGTDALVLALRAVGVKPGDEVIVPSFTFFATAEAVSSIGGVPVMADVDAATFTIDTAHARKLVTPRTKAVIPVHLYGQTADMDPLLDLAREKGLKIVEDVAQAFGAKHKGRQAGTLGDAGAFSFFPTKNLGCYGDGGMVTTADDAVATSIRKLRTHGSLKKYHNEEIGYNSRLDEVQAAILRVKLPKVDAWNEARRRVAKAYDTGLAGLPGVTTPKVAPWGTHVFHQYTLRVDGARRDGLQARLADAGVSTMVYYPVPMHRLPVYAKGAPHLPVSEAAAAEVLSLPMWPGMPEATTERVVLSVRKALTA
ncbi:MAG TPA: DegT/DnrJ/EryC1/StrS family aminotransferase [Candidatus Thermoplasmatota archaeon]|nr:DegT/DnrJ/EryC1/StrS family aminotransferase [Candidatus Thermoplasmatota archaeon]